MKAPQVFHGTRAEVMVPPSSFGRVDLAVSPSREIAGRVVRVAAEDETLLPYAQLELVNLDTGTSQELRAFLDTIDVETSFVEPGSPWENGYVESFNDKLRDELLNRELFLHVDEVRYVVDRWRMDYNHYRPHSSLGYMSPAAFAASGPPASSRGAEAPRRGRAGGPPRRCL